jgi:formylglycine-generating enzyme required for sulfatase activity
LVDIFLSYAREDLAKAKLLAAVLEKQGWSVFWDRTSLLAGQDFEEVIEQAIEQAGCMIVAWSVASKGSDWVRGEADIGRKRKILVPILFEIVEPPIAFRSIHTENFAAWSGDIQSDEFNKLCRAVTRLVGTGTGSVQASVANVNSLVPASILKQVTSKAKISVVSNQAFIEPEMVVIPAGSFQMGSNKGNDDEKPVHSVRLKSFALGRYPVTFDEYDQFAEAIGKPKPNDNGWGLGKRPVINVSWDDAIAYAKWLSVATGKLFRLPTEAEWEYAARVGTTSNYYWDGEGEAKDFAWFSENSEAKTQVVGQKKPNTFGLYDMSGNAWEWVQDCWHENYDKAPGDGLAWQAQNNGDCSRRVLRGGSWHSTPDRLRSATRLGNIPDFRNLNIGFRLAQD